MSIAYEAKACDGLERLGLSAAREQLDGAAQRAAAEQWSYTHFLGYLLDGASELAEFLHLRGEKPGRPAVAMDVVAAVGAVVVADRHVEV